ncbi:MAG: amino acid ABC transporter permease [Actinomycetes bacterium]
MSAPATERAGRPEAIQAVPVRHPGRWVASILVLVVVAMFVHGITTNERWDWSTQFQYILSPQVLRGVWTTVWLTIVSMLIGVALGAILAVMRLSPNPILSGAAWVYIWVFRGTPIIVQLFLWANVAYLYREMTVGVPFGPGFLTMQTRDLIPYFMAALLGLGLNEGAYMAEIVRAGILSVDEGQEEAATAIGMSRGQTLRRIVLPQAMRVIVPPTGNETISMLKTTSLVLIIPYGELFFVTGNLGTTLFKPFPFAILASIWYLAMTSLMMIGQYYIERHYAKGAMRNLPPTPIQKIRVRLMSSGKERR